MLKTRWLCKKGKKRVLLTLTAGEESVVFGIDRDVSEKADAAGTMSGSGVTCPSCGVIATMADLRAAGRGGRLGARMTAVVVDGQQGKEYRLPTDEEFEAASSKWKEKLLRRVYAEVPYRSARRTYRRCTAIEQFTLGNAAYRDTVSTLGAIALHESSTLGVWEPLSAKSVLGPPIRTSIRTVPKVIPKIGARRLSFTFLAPSASSRTTAAPFCSWDNGQGDFTMPYVRALRLAHGMGLLRSQSAFPILRRLCGHG